MGRIRKILVSQPEPENNKSPYFDLASKHNLKIDFRPFIHVEGVTARDFRQEKVDLGSHTAVIFTSKTSIDHYFRMAEETRTSIPDTMKYFCVSEATAYYLQKYIVYRKRKIFYGNGMIPNLVEIMNKHKDEKFLLPLSSDLSDLADVNYDILVFYSPSGIKSLFQNFPDFKQNNTKIASFGAKTAKAAEEAGLRLDITAPQPQAPSMTMALENFIKDYNKSNGKS